MIDYSLKYLCFLLLAAVTGGNTDDEEHVIYAYKPPDQYDDLDNGNDLREVETNEIPQFPQNFTNEEYSFTLFSWKIKSGIFISENNSLEELQSVFDPTLETKIVVHGWLSNQFSFVVNNTIKVYLSERNLNAIAVDWSTLAGGKMYPVTTYSVMPVGKGVAKLVRRLLEARVTTLEQLHLIGHSLGAHVMGVAGYTVSKAVGGKISRITGLDPASPMFEYIGGEASRLDTSDAEFVDIIHTSGGAAGYLGTLGHADFYPNGGTPFMPGCKELSYNAVGCSHAMSYKYYDESITNPKGFRAVECKNWASYSNGSCDNNNQTFMGDPTPPETRGVFYLTTNAESPYARG